MKKDYLIQRKVVLKQSAAIRVIEEYNRNKIDSGLQFQKGEMMRSLNNKLPICLKNAEIYTLSLLI